MEAIPNGIVKTLCVPGVPMLALPCAERPRLFIPARSGLDRWRASSLYPASRTTARVYRLFLRLRATIWPGDISILPVEASLLSAFVAGAVPGVEIAAIIVGTAGPGRKFTVALWDAAGTLVGFLKYGETVVARSRIRNEFKMLGEIPEGVGPRAIKFGPLGEGLALLATPIEGQHLPACLPPNRLILPFQKSLQEHAPPVSVDRHPWIRALVEGTDGEVAPLLKWVEVLSRRTWGVVFQHGDFAPWNLLGGRDGSLRAVDWEHGTTDGFPHTDLAYYIIQVGALICRWKPERALGWGVRYLSSQPALGLSPAEAEALVRLTAWHAYQQGLEDQHPPDLPIQSWRCALWGTV